VAFQNRRIRNHPILEERETATVSFSFNGEPAEGLEGEAVSSAVFALGVHVFGHHYRDDSPQGMFCANGQCSQCTLLIDGIPLKSCIVPLRAGMQVCSMEGLPFLEDLPGPGVSKPEELDIPALILGAGPSGLAAAVELGRAGIETILVDDKDRAGGKLVLQTHKFFGSVEDCNAGTRGIRLASMLAEEAADCPSVEVWLESVVLGVYKDGTVGIRRPDGFAIVRPRSLLVATGAREKSIPFPGCTLPGVYGAGAFQTLVNRDLVSCAERIFVLGGGNVGLIAAYHALQAGMTVVGLAEAMSVCGGYNVHTDKIARLGVPVLTRHTILAAHGGEHLEAVTTVEVDDRFRPLNGTEKTWAVDTLLVAVGLDPVDEFHTKALEFGIPSHTAGDAEEIAEASAAMFTGRIKGLEMIAELTGVDPPRMEELQEKAEVLKSPGGKVFPYEPPSIRDGVFPVLHCTQEIPCNPCMTICPKDLIGTEGHSIMGIPEFHGDCIGCRLCVAICPGLAVTLVDFRNSSERPVVTIPYELDTEPLKEGMEVLLTEWKGAVIGRGRLLGWSSLAKFPLTTLLKVEAPADIASRVAGLRLQHSEAFLPLSEEVDAALPDTAVVCRCERVSAGEIRKLIRGGIHDMNHLKAMTRAGFGACGGKTCTSLISRICREEGVSEERITPFTDRPLFAETRLGWFSGEEGSDE